MTVARRLPMLNVSLVTGLPLSRTMPGSTGVSPLAAISLMGS